MTFSEDSLHGVHNAGLAGEKLTTYYYKNYEAEWTTCFTGEESGQVKNSNHRTD